jgi:two-component system response regulator YesN
MIADDEVHIRMGLSSTIDWTTVGIAEVFTARDGEEAYKLCEEHKIEVILTDIRMPGMDGLEMAKRLHYSPFKVIVMSGYSDFEYTKRAILQGVSDYLLKPINVDHLKDVVAKAISQLEAAIHEEQISVSPSSKGLSAHQQFFANDPMLSLAEKNFDAFTLKSFEYVNNHYPERVTVESIANYLGKSKNYFSSMFKKKTGYSFVDYLAMVRLEHAKVLLRTTTFMTYEIAEKTGFTDYKYFSTTFKRYTGSTPSDFRRVKPKK